MVEINVLGSLILPLSVLSSVYFLPSVVCWAYNVPSLQIPVPKARKMGTQGFEISPWRHPVLPLFRKPNLVPQLWSPETFQP